MFDVKYVREVSGYSYTKKYRVPLLVMFDIWHSAFIGDCRIIIKYNRRTAKALADRGFEVLPIESGLGTGIFNEMFVRWSFEGDV